MKDYRTRLKAIGKEPPDEVQDAIIDYSTFAKAVRDIKKQITEVEDDEDVSGLEAQLEDAEAQVESYLERIHSLIDEWEEEISQSGGENGEYETVDAKQSAPLQSAQSRPQAPAPKKKEGSGIGWFLFATAVAVVTLGAVNAYDR